MQHTYHGEYILYRSHNLFNLNYRMCKHHCFNQEYKYNLLMLDFHMTLIQVKQEGEIIIWIPVKTTVSQ